MVDPRPYVSETEISFGDMGVPSYVDLEQVIETACNDVDAELGKRYKMPIDLDPGVQQHKAAINMLNKIARYFVIGRVVIDAAIGSEDNNLQAYGNYHLRWADKVLKDIVDGDIIIPDQESILPDDDGSRVTAPIVMNRDSRSLVDAFYNGNLPYGDLSTSDTCGGRC